MIRFATHISVCLVFMSVMIFSLYVINRSRILSDRLTQLSSSEILPDDCQRYKTNNSLTIASCIHEIKRELDSNESLKRVLIIISIMLGPLGIAAGKLIRTLL